MSALLDCPACHHPVPELELAFCATCGASLTLDGDRPNNARRDSLETWEGWNPLLASQEAAMSYWFMARSDHVHLKKMVEAWNAPDSLVRRLLVAKLDRALVGDPDQVPRDVATIGARLVLKFRDQSEQRVLTDPTQRPQPGAMSIMSPLGALLLGMLEGRSVRAQDADGPPLILTVQKVHQPEPLGAPKAGESLRREFAS